MDSARVEEQISIPSWLNVELLTVVLLQEEKGEISITGIKIEAAVPKGDNYLSTIYRIFVEYNKNEDRFINYKHFILKTLPLGEYMQKTLSEMKGFEKELQMYETTLPAMYRMMKGKYTYGKLRPLSARCFPTKRLNTIVLEDLKQLGYKMANRHTGLDLEHCKVTVRTLARLHAASVVLYNSDPTSMDIYEEMFFIENEEKRKEMNEYLKLQIDTLVNQVEKWLGYEHYADKIRALIPTAVDHMIKSLKPKKDSFNVLNHGDCWVNNMLFRYCPNTGKVEDVRFVDFQIARFSSPALDLQYFLCTSTNDEIRFKERENLLREYHEELTETMNMLNLDPAQFTFEQLKDEFEEKEMFGFLTACTVLCAVLAQKSDAPDLSDIKGDDFKVGGLNPLEKAFAGNRYRDVFQTLLLHFDSKGLL